MPSHRFADAIEDLLDEDPAELRAAARRHAEQFSWQASAARFLSLYARLSERRRVHPVFNRRRRAA